MFREQHEQNRRQHRQRMSTLPALRRARRLRPGKSSHRKDEKATRSIAHQRRSAERPFNEATAVNQAVGIPGENRKVTIT